MNQFEFNQKVYSLRDQLYRFARRILSDSDEAYDSVQDVMLKLWNKRTELNEKQSIPSYAYTITRNVCFDKLKHQKIIKQGEVELTKLTKSEISFNDEAEKFELVRRVICSLPVLQQEIMQLRDVEGLEMNEIEKITGLTENAIRVNLSRARQKVREEIIKLYSYGLSENRQHNR
jgi:RNA polymerase sigma-70 factor, ECF subfamily